MPSLPIIVEAVKCLSTVGRLCIFHKKNASKKTETNFAKNLPTQ